MFESDLNKVLDPCLDPFWDLMSSPSHRTTKRSTGLGFHRGRHASRAVNRSTMSFYSSYVSVPDESSYHQIENSEEDDYCGPPAKKHHYIEVKAKRDLPRDWVTDTAIDLMTDELEETTYDVKGEGNERDVSQANKESDSTKDVALDWMKKHVNEARSKMHKKRMEQRNACHWAEVKVLKLKGDTKEKGKAPDCH